MGKGRLRSGRLLAWRSLYCGEWESVEMKQMCYYSESFNNECHAKFAEQFEKTYHLEANTCSTCRFSKQCDVVWVPTKWADIPVHPGNGSLLVPQTIVSCQTFNNNQTFDNLCKNFTVFQQSCKYFLFFLPRHCDWNWNSKSNLPGMSVAPVLKKPRVPTRYPIVTTITSPLSAISCPQ